MSEIGNLAMSGDVWSLQTLTLKTKTNKLTGPVSHNNHPVTGTASPARTSMAKVQTGAMVAVGMTEVAAVGMTEVAAVVVVTDSPMVVVPVGSTCSASAGCTGAAAA